MSIVGPEHGSLVLAGGGAKGLPEIIRQFLALAGGLSARIAIIPTAYEDDYPGPYTPYNEDFMDAGATNLAVLHTRDRETADSESFVELLNTASGVWFTGGRHWRLADVYLGTRTEDALRSLLDRGGVIGGTSAGATIQGSHMIRGDTSGNQVVLGDHQQGLGFLRNVSVDQHHLRGNRQFDMIEVVEKHPDLLGLGIDEDTAVLVRGDEARIIGQSYVAVYDNRRTLGEGGRFYFLAAGDRYNLATRRLIDPAPIRATLEERMRDTPWH